MKAQPRLLFFVVAILLTFIISNFSYARSGRYYKSHSPGFHSTSHISHSRVHSGGSYSRSHESSHWSVVEQTAQAICSSRQKKQQKPKINGS